MIFGDRVSLQKGLPQKDDSVFPTSCTILNKPLTGGAFSGLTPQDNLLFVEQASCLFSIAVQDVSCPHIVTHKGSRRRKVLPEPNSLRALRLPRCARVWFGLIAESSP